METVSTAAPVSAPPRRRPCFLVGGLLFLLGPIIYAVQFSLKQLVVPWYVPILATLGVLLMVASVRQRGSVLRAAGLVLFVVMCGFEWFVLLAGSKLPDYTGPAQAGRKMPVYSATLAGGQAFTESDLEKGQPTVVLFFRGRW